MPVSVKLTQIKTAKYGLKESFAIDISGNIPQIITDLEIQDQPLHLLLTNDSKRAFLAGAFLSGGSINSPESRNYHIEFQTTSMKYATLLKKCLKSFHIQSLIRERKSKYIVYCKRSEMISDILKIFGSVDAMFEYEDRRLEAADLGFQDQ